MRIATYVVVVLGWMALNYAFRYAHLNTIATVHLVLILPILAALVVHEHRLHQARTEMDVPVHHGWRDGKHVRRELGTAPKGMGARWRIDLDRRVAVMLVPVEPQESAPELPIEHEAEVAAAEDSRAFDEIRERYAAIQDEATVKFAALTDELNQHFQQAAFELGLTR